MGRPPHRAEQEEEHRLQLEQQRKKHAATVAANEQALRTVGDFASESQSERDLYICCIFIIICSICFCATCARDTETDCGLLVTYGYSSVHAALPVRHTVDVRCVSHREGRVSNCASLHRRRRRRALPSACVWRCGGVSLMPCSHPSLYDTHRICMACRTGRDMHTLPVTTLPATIGRYTPCRIHTVDVGRVLHTPATLGG